MKKVLLIDARTGSDWTMDLLFAGLVDALGPERVIDWPIKMKHRAGVPIVTGDNTEDWKAERSSLGYHPRYAELNSYTLHEVNQEIKAGNVGAIFIDEREETFSYYLKTVARFFDVPVIVVAGHDRFWNRSPEYVRQNYYGKNFRSMLIDNWSTEYDSLPYAKLINWCNNFDHLWDPSQRENLLSDKRYDISFMGYNSHPDRARIVDHVQSKWGHLNNHIVLERRPDTMEIFVPKREYFRVMAQSKICLNLRGAAECGKALRFYEVPYVGSFMLSQRFDGKQLHPFMHAQHCTYFGDLGEMDAIIDMTLKDERWREGIAKSGHEHSMTLHSLSARTEYILRSAGVYEDLSR